jgi:uncharacterized damage-inducible protein DinB
MTVPIADPPLEFDELVSASGEREVLEAFLDLYRAIVVRKVADLPTEQAHRRLVPSRTTPASLLAHLTEVEREWFQVVLARHAPDQLGPPHRDDDGWDVAPDETVDALVAAYRAACTDSRRVAAGFVIDDTVPHPRMGQVTLRWIYVHLIEETARHAGHADILREQIDGATGFDG